MRRLAQQQTSAVHMNGPRGHAPHPVVDRFRPAVARQSSRTHDPQSELVSICEESFHLFHHCYPRRLPLPQSRAWFSLSDANLALGIEHARSRPLKGMRLSRMQ